MDLKNVAIVMNNVEIYNLVKNTYKIYNEIREPLICRPLVLIDVRMKELSWKVSIHLKHHIDSKKDYMNKGKTYSDMVIIGAFNFEFFILLKAKIIVKKVQNLSCCRMIFNLFGLISTTILIAHLCKHIYVSFNV